LFCGCGGFSHGFQNAGHKIVVGNDIWEDALETYKINHPKSYRLLGDIRDTSVKDALYKEVKNTKIDIMIGGPPCQAYSLAGRRDSNDPRAHLFKEYLSIVKKISPDYVLMENVKGILSMKIGEEYVKDTIVSELEGLGYTVEYRLCNTANYGVPQKRERVIFAGSKKGVKPYEFPEETHSIDNWMTIFEAINKYEDLAENPEISHIFTNHGAEFLNKIRTTAIGTNVLGTYSDAFYRCPPDEPSRTVKENHGSVFIHYSKDRVMTPRELAALQSFGDNFLFFGKKSSVLKQIGNAVPPKFAENLAKFFNSTTT